MIRLNTVLLLICALTSCTIAPPIDPELTDRIRVVDVTVQTDGLRTAPLSLLEEIGQSEAQVGNDIARALRSELVPISSDGVRAVTMDFSIEMILLNRTLQPERPGGFIRTNYDAPYSQIFSILQIRDSTTGEILVARQGIAGNDNFGEHSFENSGGSMFDAPISTRQAYDDVVKGFAADTRRIIFEFEGLMTLAN